MSSTMADVRPLRTVSVTDLQTLRQLGHGALPPALDEVLDGRRLVPDAALADDVVALGRTVRLRLEGEPSVLTVRLCTPAEARPADGWISVLAPLGVALFGARAGESVHWPLPSGGRRGARVETVGPG